MVLSFLVKTAKWIQKLKQTKGVKPDHLICINSHRLCVVTRDVHRALAVVTSDDRHEGVGGDAVRWAGQGQGWQSQSQEEEGQHSV